MEEELRLIINRAIDDIAPMLYVQYVHEVEPGIWEVRIIHDTEEE
jgi:hypothetical protein